MHKLIVHCDSTQDLKKNNKNCMFELWFMVYVLAESAIPRHKNVFRSIGDYVLLLYMVVYRILKNFLRPF